MRWGVTIELSRCLCTLWLNLLVTFEQIHNHIAFKDIPVTKQFTPEILTVYALDFAAFLLNLQMHTVFSTLW